MYLRNDKQELSLREQFQEYFKDEEKNFQNNFQKIQDEFLKNLLKDVLYQTKIRFRDYIGILRQIIVI